MSYQIVVEHVKAELIAAVGTRIAPRDIPVRFRQSLDTVWVFVRRHPNLRSDGHNVFCTTTTWTPMA